MPPPDAGLAVGNSLNFIAVRVGGRICWHVMRGLWACMSLLWHLSMAAQATEPPLRKFHFDHFSPELGQSTGVINDLHRDRQGFLWMGTYNGLYCFDGNHYKSWKGDPFNPKALNSSVVHGICEDMEGNIWMATERGLSRFDRKEFRNFTLVDQVSGKELTYGTWKVVCTPKGEVVVETFAGVYIYDPSRDQMVQYPAIRGDSARFVYVHKNTFTLDTLRNRIWMGTDRGVVYFDLATRTYTDALDHPAGWDESMSRNVLPLTLDPKGRLVFHDRSIESIVTWDPETHRSSHRSTQGWYHRKEYFATIYFDNQDNVWISSWSPRMYCIDGKTGRASRFIHDPADPYSSSGAFFWDAWQDHDGTLYLGTTNGLSVTNLNRNFFTIVGLPPDVNHRTDYFGSLFLGEDLQGGLWVAPSYQYLLRYDQGTGEFRRYDPLGGEEDFENEAHYINSMVATEDSLYFAGSGGIFVLDVKTDRLAPVTDIPLSVGVKGHHIKRHFLAENGDWWMAVHELGILRYNIHSQRYKLYQDHSGSPNPWSERLMGFVKPDRQGNIWVSVDQYGLIRYNPRRDDFDIPPPEKRKILTRYGPGNFVQEPNGTVWYNGTSFGILRYHPGTGLVDENFPRQQFSHMYYGGLALVQDRQLWLSFYNQFTIMDVVDGTVENFTINHSLADVKWWNQLDPLRDGRLVSESRNALIIFDPKQRGTLRPTDPIVISNLSTSGKTIGLVPEGEEVNLFSSQNVFSIDFGTLASVKGGRLQFQYKLEGLDPEWVDCGTRRTAFYTNVPGGSFTFRVRVREGEGAWRETPNPLRIHVDHVFYKAPWFRVGLSILLVAILVWWMQARRQVARKRDSEQAIRYFANSLYGNNHVDDILWDITHNVITRTDLVDCVVYLLNDKTGKMEQRAAFGEKNPAGNEIVNRIELEPGAGIVGAAAESRQVVMVPDTRKDPRYVPDQGQALSEVAVPIIHEGRVIGVIDSEHPRRGFFKQRHIDLLNTIASISATKIANALRESEIKEKEARLRDLQVQVSETRQQALRAQMNPHFIFNCLNSINSFILENHADTASTYLIKFAKLIRLILENSNNKLIPLQSELDALRLYIEMESLRFETKFAWEIAVDDSVATHHVQVPPLILQPFVENAIWHGLLHKEGQGMLSVSLTCWGDRLHCAITDNGVGREAARARRAASIVQKQSLGLQLTQERLALMNAQEDKHFEIAITDLYDADGKPIGTRVLIEMEIKEE